MSALPVSVTVTIKPLSCGACGVWFGVEETILEQRRRDGNWFWCPRGCKIHYGEFENARLKRELEAKERAIQYERERTARITREREHQAARARTYRGHLTRVRKRVGNGVCPCCQRTFENLSRHMKSKHPAYGEPPK